MAGSVQYAPQRTVKKLEDRGKIDRSESCITVALDI
jgi:hypothetical protein